MKFKNIIQLMKNPKKIIKVLGKRELLNWIPDKMYLKLIYRGEMNEKLNLKNPKTFTEKLQWLKLYNRKFVYASYVDKYRVREYISEELGDEYLIPLITVYDNANEIKWDELPKKIGR